jgi:hypothetical protein
MAQRARRKSTYGGRTSPEQKPNALFKWLGLSPLPLWGLWKFIEIGGDVDFLLSITGRLGLTFEMISTWGWIPLTMLGLWWFQSVRASPTGRPSALLLISSILLTSVIAFALGNSTDRQITLIPTYGIDGGIPYGVVNTIELERYAKSHNLVLAVWVQDSSIDQNSDPAVMFSKPFGITGGRVRIEVVPTEPYMKKLREMSERHRGSVTVSRAAFLVPKEIDPSLFRTINDARAMGAFAPQ